MKKFIDSAIILAISTAVLYCWSTAYYHGFLIAASLDADVMERSFHQILYRGLVVSYAPIIMILLGISSLYFVYGRVIVPEYVNYAKMGVGQTRKIINFKIGGLAKESLLTLKLGRKDEQIILGLCWWQVSHLYFR